MVVLIAIRWERKHDNELDWMPSITMIAKCIPLVLLQQPGSCSYYFVPRQSNKLAIFM